MELRKVTVDYTIAFARVLRTASLAAAFSFLSGGGADATARSRLAFARYRGEAENALLAAAFSRVYRPHTSIRWSGAKNRISVTACCAESTRCFSCCSPIR
jgi:hypothetical protein